MLFKGFPDLYVSVEDITTEGEKVWDRVTVTGTHTGEYRGIPPTGKKITFTGIRIWRIVDGARAARQISGLYKKKIRLISKVTRNVTWKRSQKDGKQSS